MGTLPTALILNHVRSWTGLQWKEQNNSSEAHSPLGGTGILYLLEPRVRTLRAKRSLDGCPVWPSLACHVASGLHTSRDGECSARLPIPAYQQPDSLIAFFSGIQQTCTDDSGPGTVLSTGSMAVNLQGIHPLVSSMQPSYFLFPSIPM